MTYNVLDRICVMIDMIQSEDGRSKVVALDTGCYPNGEAGHYTRAVPDKLYKFEFVPVEVRSRYDPYTVWTKSDYSLGKDYSMLLNITYILLISGLFFAVLTCASYSLAKQDLDHETQPLTR